MPFDIVRVEDDGQCVPVTFDQTASGMLVDGQMAHIHLHDKKQGVALLSHSHADARIECAASFVLPPPLNTYVLPSPIYMAHMNESGEVIVTSVDDAIRLVEQLHSAAAVRTDKEMVYHVPETEETIPASDGESETDDDADASDNDSNVSAFEDDDEFIPPDEDDGPTAA